jgi:hypothetical protein
MLSRFLHAPNAIETIRDRKIYGQRSRAVKERKSQKVNRDKNDIAVAMRINFSGIGNKGRFEFVSAVYEATLIRGWGWLGY